MYRTWQAMTRSQNRTIPSLQLAIYFGNDEFPSGNQSCLFRLRTELKTIFEDKRYCNSLGPMTVTDNGFFGCHTVEHADQNSFLDTDINLNVLSYLSSDDKSLIQRDGNSTYMCETSSSVNKKNMKSVEIFVFLNHMYVRVADGLYYFLIY